MSNEKILLMRLAQKDDMHAKAGIHWDKYTQRQQKRYLAVGFVMGACMALVGLLLLSWPW